MISSKNKFWSLCRAKKTKTAEIAFEVTFLVAKANVNHWIPEKLQESKAKVFDRCYAQNEKELLGLSLCQRMQ